MSWHDWTRFFDSLPKDLYAIHRTVPEQSLGEIIPRVVQGMAAIAIRRDLDRLHDLEGKKASEFLSHLLQGDSSSPEGKPAG